MSAIARMGVKDVRLNTLDLEEAGDTAYEVGEAVLSLASGSVTAKYVVVWKKSGGAWRLHRDIWNNKGALEATRLSGTPGRTRAGQGPPGE